MNGTHISRTPLSHLSSIPTPRSTTLYAEGCANYTAIPGKGSKEAVISYRLISLSKVAGKILERITARNPNDYCEANNMLNNCQPGGRCGRSTVTNLLACECSNADFMNIKKPYDVITVDFMRACDKICHKILCDKIKAFGIDGYYMSWIINFLSDRLQYVVYDSVKSTAAAVPSGIIQGSAIGGILFCMFINDLCDGG